MKIEVEITEEEIRSAIARKVRVAIADQTNQWSVDDYIVKAVKNAWQSAADNLVRECLANSEKLKEKITTAIERKLKSQINKLMK